jgi:DNA-binding transcriptional regulator YiaG
MEPKEFRQIREWLDLGREEMAELLGLSGYMAVSNIEIGVRNPNKLAVKFLRYLHSMTKKNAKGIIEEINKFNP